jgi:hypothetical protein
MGRWGDGAMGRWGDGAMGAPVFVFSFGVDRGNRIRSLVVIVIHES